jgi:hypothetical protein
MADTLVTLSNIAVKGKIIARLRRVRRHHQTLYSEPLNVINSLSFAGHSKDVLPVLQDFD